VKIRWPARIAVILAAILACAEGYCLWTVYSASAVTKPANLGNTPENISRVEHNIGNPLKFAVVSDIHGKFGTFEKLLGQLRDEHLAFIVLLGDIAYLESTIPEHKFLQLEIQETGVQCPIFYVVGNHDFRDNHDPRFFTTKMWRETYGPDQFAFTVNGNLFIMLNCQKENQTTEASADFLKQALEKRDAERVFVFNHIPPMPLGFKGSLPQELSAPLLEIIKAYRVDYVLSGHNHTYAAFNYSGTRFLISGGGGGGFHEPVKFGFHHAMLFSISDAGVEERLIVVNANDTLEDRLQRMILLTIYPFFLAWRVQALCANLLIFAVLAVIIYCGTRRSRRIEWN